MSKVCIRCRTDCSGRPRVRDGSGSYICKACLRPAEAARFGAGSLQTAVAPIEVAPVATADPIRVRAPVGLQLCPECQSSIPYGMTLCVQCGYDAAKGRQHSTEIGVEAEPEPQGPPSGKCYKCGYSLQGLKSPRCPECGAISTRVADIRERMRRQSQETMRWAYIKPLIHLAIGAALLLAIIFTSADPRAYAIFYGLKLAIGVPIGVVSFFLCCLIYMGFDAPMHLTALRLAGVYALTDGLGGLIGLAGIPFIPFTITMAIYVCLLADALDVDLQDAVIIGLVTWLIKWFGLIAIFVYVLETEIL
jgi:hypothetical protein